MKNTIKYIIICLILPSECFGQKSDSLTTVIDSPELHRQKVVKKKDKSDLENSEKTKYEDKIKTWMPLVTTLIVLLVSNGMILYKINRDTREGVRKDIIISKIKLDRDRLEKFYDPILTLLKANSEMFSKYGPNTFPNDSGPLETEASEIWKRIVEDIIIPNNKKICDRVQDFSHLIMLGDSIEPYLNYFTHAQSYKHFVSNPNGLHKSFKYPVDFLPHVEKNRTQLLKVLTETEKKLKI